MARDDSKLPQPSSRKEIDAFLRDVSRLPATVKPGSRGRLMFAMDATASREPVWDRATHIQSQMFLETKNLGGLDVQLVWYRGFLEFHASRWTSNAEDLLDTMTGIRCAAGQTQIGRVLDHALAEHRRRRLNALVFVGDCMEEDIDKLADRAGRLGLAGVPAFLFQDGNDPIAERAFRQFARLSGGAWCRFDAGSADQLRDLLCAVAVFAAGGRRALEDFGRRGSDVVRRLTHQVRDRG
jgi:hypothetical protein